MAPRFAVFAAPSKEFLGCAATLASGRALTFWAVPEPGTFMLFGAAAIVRAVRTKAAIRLNGTKG